jgi:hypothetical protein
MSHGKLRSSPRVERVLTVQSTTSVHSLHSCQPHATLLLWPWVYLRGICVAARTVPDDNEVMTMGLYGS